MRRNGFDVNIAKVRNARNISLNVEIDDYRLHGTMPQVLRPEKFKLNTWGHACC